ncbi:MAG: hypothetical protein HY293_05825 [Planctomycetes bacterium]|nr:hypothetical protein [Planctomycetota bacterium]
MQEMTLRLLTTDKKGIGKRIADSVRAAGGKVEQQRLKRELRGMSETEIVVSFGSEALRRTILDSVGRIPGVALIGSV